MLSYKFMRTLQAHDGGPEKRTLALRCKEITGCLFLNFLCFCKCYINYNWYNYCRTDQSSNSSKKKKLKLFSILFRGKRSPDKPTGGGSEQTDRVKTDGQRQMEYRHWDRGSAGRHWDRESADRLRECRQTDRQTEYRQTNRHTHQHSSLRPVRVAPTQSHAPLSDHFHIHFHHQGLFPHVLPLYNIMHHNSAW